MKAIISRIKNIIHSNKGVSSIEIALGTIIFIVAVCGFVDLTTILNKINTISTTTTSVARIIGEQGGVQNLAPAGYNEDYLTSKQLYENISRSLELSGIPEDDWAIYINGTKLNGTAQKFGPYNYGKNIEVKLVMDYKWSLLSNFIPGNIKQTKSATRNIISSFQIRDGDFKTDY